MEPLHAANGAQEKGSGSAPVLGKRSFSVSEPETEPEKKAKASGLDDDGLQVAVQAAGHYALGRPAAPFQQPVPIASFSYDESRTLHHDNRSRRFYHPPPPRADLNRGFEEVVERDESVNEHLDSLLLSLMRLEKAGKDEHRRRANLITWRGMMTKLCTLLYEDRQGFDMNAMMIGDTLYLEEYVGASQKEEKAKQQANPRLKRFGYYGYSFESWTCSQEVRPRDPWDGNVNTNVQWCSIIKTKLGDTRCILAGEVDAVDADRHAPVEVKTSMNIRNGQDEERFEKKMLRFYMQSFLLGIAMVVVGFRDPRGFLVTHQQFQTLAMPRAVRGKAHAWDPLACLNFASELLTTIRSHLLAAAPASLPSLEEAEKSDGYPVHRITFDPDTRRVGVRVLASSDVLEQVKGGMKKGRVGFLLSSYYDMARASHFRHNVH